MRDIIVAWKDQDRAHLSRVLAPLLARTVRTALGECTPLTRQLIAAGGAVAVPIPSRAAGTRVRGRVPVTEVLRMVLPDRAPGAALRPLQALKYVRPVRDQAGLGHRDRAQNVTGAMAVSSRLARHLEGVPVILVDDILTTGSTLAEATRVVRAAGAGPVLAVALSATERRSTRGPDRDPAGIPPECSRD
ncbi:MAG: phosphoribosyltransferase family protein [Ornithinimicrobium sp.]